MKGEKKIAVVCNYRLMPDRVGGMDRFFWLFDAACKLKGYEVVWFFPNSGHHGQYGGLTIISAENETLEHFFLEYCKEKVLRFDIVVTHFLELCTSFFKSVKAYHPSKTIAVDHNPRPIEDYPLKKRITKRIKGLLYSRYTDLFIGVSAYTKYHILRDFGQHLKSKTLIIYNGIAHELYQKREARNTRKPSFLVACHLRYSKGIQDLIAAVALLPEPIKHEIKIDIYGTGEYERELLKQISEAKLQSVFSFKGSVPNLYAIFCLYDYLLQPTHMECFSLSILESLSANVPVITTPVGGNMEVITNGVNGYIFEEKNVEVLKELLEKLFLGQEGISIQTNALIENNFSIETMVKEHMSIL